MRDKLFLRSLEYLLWPVIRYCVRHSVKLQDFSETAKLLYVRASEEQLAAEESKASDARISLVSGVHRKDVARLRDSGTKGSPKETAASKDLITRVIGHWQHSEEFTTDQGRPRVLACEGSNSQFAALVACISREVNPYTVLFELERIGAVQRDSNKVRLEVQMFNPKRDLLHGFQLCADDCDDLLQTVEENLVGPADGQENLHIKTEYNNVPVRHMGKIKQWMLHEGSEFHRRVRTFLSGFDRDISGKTEEGGGKLRVALAAFSRVEILEQPEEDQDA